MGLFRPVNAILTPGHPLWNGCKLALLGQHAGGNTAYDSSPWGNNGTLQSATWTKYTDRHALLGSSTNRYVDGFTAPAAGAFSISWLGRNDSTSSTGLTAWFSWLGAAPYNGLITESTTEDDISVLDPVGNRLNTWDAAFPYDGELYHFTYTQTGSGAGQTVELFRDGVSLGSSTETTDAMTTFTIGKFGAADTRTFRGAIGDAIVHSRVLADSEIATLASPDPMYGGALWVPSTTLTFWTGGGAVDESEATASVELGGASVSASGSSTAPSFNSSVDSNTGGVTASVDGTVADPEYTASLAPSVGSVSASVSATFTAPSYSATVGVESGSLLASLSATFTDPIYSAETAGLVGGSSASVSATFSTPDYSASVGVSSGAYTAALSSTFTAPVYSASIATSSPGVTGSISAAFTDPVYSSTVAVTSGAVDTAASGTTSDPSYTASVTLSAGSIVASASGSFTSPVYSATVDTQLSGVSVDASASFASAVFLGSVSASVGTTEANVSASFEAGTKTSSVEVEVGAMVPDASATYTPVGTPFVIFAQQQMLLSV